MDFGDLSDNPFALSEADFARPRKSALKRALRTLAMVAVGLALTLVASTQVDRWLVYRYTYDFDSLSSEQKRVRLTQLADLGTPGLEPLVASLADSDTSVARTAYDLLHETQQQWAVLNRNARHQRQRELVDQLHSIAIHLPDSRTGWGTSLLQSTVQSTVDSRDASGQLLYKRAIDTLDLLALSDRAGPSILEDGSNDPAAAVQQAGMPRRIQVRSQPLPVEQAEPIGRGWTDWPPSPSQDSTVVLRPAGSSSGAETRPPQESRQTESADAIPGSTVSPTGRAPEEAIAEGPSVYKSSATQLHGGSAPRLRSVDPEQAILLQDIDGVPLPRTPREVAPQATGTIQSVVHLVDAPMDGLDDSSVIHWLGSENPRLRSNATKELKKRGFNERELTLATQLAGRDRLARLALIDVIARDSSIDPRPWLLMLLKDESRDVKLKAVAVLGTMNDPEITAQLQSHLISERDTHVAARIRKVLQLR